MMSDANLCKYVHSERSPSGWHYKLHSFKFSDKNIFYLYVLIIDRLTQT